VAAGGGDLSRRGKVTAVSSSPEDVQTIDSAGAMVSTRAVGSKSAQRLGLPPERRDAVVRPLPKPVYGILHAQSSRPGALLPSRPEPYRCTTPDLEKK